MVNVNAQVEYFNLVTNQKMQAYKLDSQFVFENIFAIFDADERALSEEQLLLTKGAALPFPSNEQMLFDAAITYSFAFCDGKRHETSHGYLFRFMWNEAVPNGTTSRGFDKYQSLAI